MGANPRSHPLALSAAGHAIFASSIFTNNIQVTFLAFAGGLTLGAGDAARAGLQRAASRHPGRAHPSGAELLGVRALVVPHGMLELSCFAVAGAAGLRLAWAMVDPGPLTRGASLRGPPARRAIVLGTAPGWWWPG